MGDTIFRLWVALIALGVLQVFLGLRYVLPPGSPLRRTRDLNLAVELVPTAADFDLLVGGAETPPGKRNRQTLRWSQYLDFAMIVAYAGLFWRLGGLEIEAGPLWATACGWTARLAIVPAGLFDAAEDVAILGLAAGTSRNGVRRFGRPKWISFFLAAATLAPLFLPPLCHARLGRLPGALLLAGGLLGLAAGLSGKNRLIQAGFLLTLLGIALMASLVYSPALCGW